MSRRARYALLVLTLYLTFCTVAGIFVADGTLHPARRPLTVEKDIATQNVAKELNASFVDVSISTEDAVTLRAWLIVPRHSNHDAVLLLHGLGDNRLGMTGYAQLLLATRRADASHYLHPQQIGGGGIGVVYDAADLKLGPPSRSEVPSPEQRKPHLYRPSATRVGHDCPACVRTIRLSSCSR
jgi:hypothetical protein